VPLGGIRSSYVLILAAEKCCRFCIWVENKTFAFVGVQSAVSDTAVLSEAMSKQRETERRFLEQLLDGSKIDNYKIPVPVSAELRKYQQDGVNWLAFLNKYHLSGILCDDMGLGKTLQTLCMLLGDHVTRQLKYEVRVRP
jgi:TATA-binding protein-associated factor